MGILNQLRYSFTKQRIDKEVDEKVDRLQEIIKGGGSKEEMKEAIADLTRPTEFNEVVGALGVLVPAWFAAKLLSQENEIIRGGISIQSLFNDAISDTFKFFGQGHMAKFIIVQALKKEASLNYGELSWDTINSIFCLGDEYHEYGWKAVALYYLVLNLAERRHGEGGCTKKVFDSIFYNEIMVNENLDKLNGYLESLTDEQCAYYQCLQEV